jgi:hypothetical protein
MRLEIAPSGALAAAEATFSTWDRDSAGSDEIAASGVGQRDFETRRWINRENGRDISAVRSSIRTRWTGRESDDDPDCGLIDSRVSAFPGREIDWDRRSSTFISERSIRRIKMTEPPLQTNKVWAVMLYSNSGEVMGGVRTAPHLFRTHQQAMAEASLGSLTRPSLGSVSMMTSTPPNCRITQPTCAVGCYQRN